MIESVKNVTKQQFRYATNFLFKHSSHKCHFFKFDFFLFKVQQAKLHSRIVASMVYLQQHTIYKMPIQVAQQQQQQQLHWSGVKKQMLPFYNQKFVQQFFLYKWHTKIIFKYCTNSSASASLILRIHNKLSDFLVYKLNVIFL